MATDSADPLAQLKARRRALKERVQRGDTIARVQLEKLRTEIDAIEYPPITSREGP